MTNTHHSIAADLVMQDLLDCLLAEDFFGTLDANLIEPAAWHAAHPQAPFADLEVPHKVWHWHYDAAEQRGLAVALRAGITQAWEKVPGTPVLDVQGDSTRVLSPDSFMTLALKGVKVDALDNDKGIELFMDVLRTSVRQTALSLDHKVATSGLLEKDGAAFFLAMEQWASLRDRPFHPLAKAKQGLDDAQYRQYQAEFDQSLALNWVAVAKASLTFGAGIDGLDGCQPAQYILSADQRASLDAELRALGIADSHVALPVHPWQLQRVLPAQLGAAFERGECRRLDFQDGSFNPTSSLRSLACAAAPADHIKLPMAVYSLGASRYLPAVKMINGGLSEALLRQGRERDPVLREALHICDESKWWGYMPDGGTLFDEAPRHLSAMVRGYPPKLFEDAATRLLPMAALGTPLPDSERHFFDDCMSQRGLPAGSSSVLQLFSELCELFFDVNLRMFRLGMLGEVHGQNAVLVYEAGKARGLLLRDHDSLRLYVPWLERNGMLDPQYRIKKGHAQTLYHERPEDLLFWLQTLGIQVNLRGIIDTLERVYAVPSAQAWRVLRDSLSECIATLPFDESARALLRRELFESETWPQKLLLRPMIERAGGPGSMPFGKGLVVNPFNRIEFET
ncbi:AcsA protein [Pseudomonas daroniae]|uniref:AcsA protein n=1 Tax=Phytopseudomonas daroniae TaxID=2487519 RepID=A0A4Q9QMG1_9GAMM|nr:MULTISPECIES: IucA/IucC family protein [Pseudomonas]TBU77912.1 AcsA protein [Pseudomonas daroniae]TBU82260.1 AcsA protein [Pseudomonas sp. FRB 228]TBU91113.1 AcsA protein [Pseudomonas daroniae]